jgi:hypothetical protein
MMKGLSLVDLAKKIEFNKQGKKDFIADSSRLAMRAETVGGNQEFRTTLEVPQQGAFPITPLAHDQIGGRLKIPSQYYNRMLNTAPELLATNVNAWFQLNPEKRMVRTMHGAMRSFNSNRYNRIENEEIAEVALPILYDIPDVQIVSSEITDRRMYIQAVAPRITGEVKKGDIVQAGVVISNSEVGCGAVSVAALDFRLICLNGAISQDKFRAYHVGRNIDDNVELWADDTRKADDRAVLLKIRDMVRSAVNEVRFRERLDRMKELAGVKVSGKLERAIEVLGNKIGTTEDERGSILRALIEGADLSAWGMLNAVTAQSHTARSYDRAVEFEAAGGRLLELGKNEWKEVLEAA